MTTQDYETITHALLNAAFSRAANGLWATTTLLDICQTANISYLQIRQFYTSRDDLITAYARRLDARLATDFPNQTINNDTPKDRLFDILMNRFEYMQDNRDGLVGILHSVRHDPKQILTGLPSAANAATFMLELAGIPTDGWQGCLNVAKLLGVYASGLWAWCDDTSPDLPKTMAALDKNLTRCGF